MHPKLKPHINIKPKTQTYQNHILERPYLIRGSCCFQVGKFTVTHSLLKIP